MDGFSNYQVKEWRKWEISGDCLKVGSAPLIDLLCLSSIIEVLVDLVFAVAVGFIFGSELAVIPTKVALSGMEVLSLTVWAVVGEKLGPPPNMSPYFQQIVQYMIHN